MTWHCEVACMALTLSYTLLVLHDITSTPAARYTNPSWFESGFCIAWETSLFNSHYLCFAVDLPCGTSLAVFSWRPAVHTCILARLIAVLWQEHLHGSLVAVTWLLNLTVEPCPIALHSPAVLLCLRCRLSLCASRSAVISRLSSSYWLLSLRVFDLPSVCLRHHTVATPQIAPRSVSILLGHCSRHSRQASHSLRTTDCLAAL